VKQNRIEHDDLGSRVILYMSDAAHQNRNLVKQFCAEKCIYRNSTLEDVFLRLTGRELRE
jgi:lipooligosaccharide transport system ATP-binding protein